MFDGLQTWAEGLSEPDAQLMLIEAAKRHSHGFSNPEEIGVSWTQMLKRHGYNSLCPYSRNFMAFKYLEHCNRDRTPAA